MGREEVGVKCGCMQGCCVGARPGLRFADHCIGRCEHEDKQSRC